MLSFDAYIYVILALALVVAAWVFYVAKKRFAMRWPANLIGAGWVAMAVFMICSWWLSASGIMAQTIGPDAPKVTFAAPMNATIIAMFWYVIAIQWPSFKRFVMEKMVD